MEDTSAPVDQAIEDVRRSRSETLETIELLRASRQQVDEGSARLESPTAVVQYIDFFIGLFTGVSADLERVAAELPGGALRAHVETLRQIASNASAEQRRCLMFRDKWINRPLPYEDMRRLLNQISVDSRDQLTAYRSLNTAADRLDQIASPPPKPQDDGRLDRRALFTRWFGR